MDPYRGSKRSSISFGSSQKKFPSYQSHFMATSYGNNAMNPLYENNHGGGSSSSSNPSTNQDANDPKNSEDNKSVNSLYATRSPLYSPLDFSSPMFPSNYSQIHQQIRNYNPVNSAQPPTNNMTVCEYSSHYPLLGLAWSNDDTVCLGSYKEDSRNKLQAIRSTDLLTWEKVAEADITYPVSNIQWLPNQIHPRQLATSSDSLRIWSLNDEVGQLQEQINLSLCKYKKQNNNHNHNSAAPYNSSNATADTSQWGSGVLGELPPVTSFHWNPVDTNLLISSSIDTTCIVWDLQSSNYVKTQLIAHDSEVFDVRFLTKSTQLFASCGGDGSVRVFDLRSLAHSTIIYEPPTTSLTGDLAQQNNALLRLEPSPTDPNVLATFVCDSNSILILDMRRPESPVLTLDGHSSSVNQIKWHPTKRNVLLSCGDDCQILCWDLNNYLNNGARPMQKVPEESNRDEDINMMKDSEPKLQSQSLSIPTAAFSNNCQEYNNITWRPQGGDWIGSVSGKKFQNIRVG